MILCEFRYSYIGVEMLCYRVRWYLTQSFLVICAGLVLGPLPEDTKICVCSCVLHEVV